MWRILMLILLAATSSYAAVYDPNYDDTDALFDWICSVGGFSEPLHTICSEVPGNPSSVHGVFADSDIASGDLLIDLPCKETLIYSDE